MDATQLRFPDKVYNMWLCNSLVGQIAAGANPDSTNLKQELLLLCRTNSDMEMTWKGVRTL